MCIGSWPRDVQKLQVKVQYKKCRNRNDVCTINIIKGCETGCYGSPPMAPPAAQSTTASYQMCCRRRWRRGRNRYKSEAFEKYFVFFLWDLVTKVQSDYMTWWRHNKHTNIKTLHQTSCSTNKQAHSPPKLSAPTTESMTKNNMYICDMLNGYLNHTPPRPLEKVHDEHF